MSDENSISDQFMVLFTLPESIIRLVLIISFSKQKAKYRVKYSVSTLMYHLSVLTTHQVTNDDSSEK